MSKRTYIYGNMRRIAMDKLDMLSRDNTQENIKKIQTIFILRKFNVKQQDRY